MGSTVGPGAHTWGGPSLAPLDSRAVFLWLLLAGGFSVMNGLRVTELPVSSGFLTSRLTRWNLGELGRAGAAVPGHCPLQRDPALLSAACFLEGHAPVRPEGMRCENSQTVLMATASPSD